MAEFFVFIVCLFAFPAGAASAAHLLYFCIQKGEIFGGWQKVLMKIHPKDKKRNAFAREFFYKRMGGCDICFRQTIAELSFIAFIALWTSYAVFPTTNVESIVLRWFCNICLFVAYSGISLTVGQSMEKKEEKPHRIEEEIIRVKPRTN